MKGATMLATLQKLGVMPSFSRPSVSNDNPYSEALFKTLKYHPGFPDKPFDCLESARVWVTGFQHWYNEVHRHSALKFVAPGQRHRGEDIVILEERQRLYGAAKAKQPERWSKKIRDWTPVGTVYLNPGKSVKKEVEFKQKKLHKKSDIFLDIDRLQCMTTANLENSQCYQHLTCVSNE